MSFDSGPVIQAALEYVKSGLSVVPIKVDGSKQPPPGVSWKWLQEKRPSPYRISQLFRGEVGVAVIGGKVSGSLEIIDFDRPSLIDPWTVLVEAAAPGLLARITRVKTPKGGAHFYYRCPEIEGNEKLAQEPPSIDEKTGEPRPNTLIETRGEGGYVLAPKSPPGCHPTGRTYEYVSGPPLLEISTITAAERKILLDAARSFNKWTPTIVHSGESGRTRLPGDPLRPGDDWNRRASWDEILTPHGWSALKTVGESVQWRRPGKSDGGMSATTGHCGDNLYVFSSNAAPFSSNTAYTKFAAFAILEYSGDFVRAAKGLAERGYGEANDPAKIAANEKEFHEFEETFKEVEAEEPAVGSAQEEEEASLATPQKDYKKKKDAQKAKDPKDIYFDGRTFLPEPLALEISSRYKFIATPIGDDGLGARVYVYRDGVFKHGAESLIVDESRAALGHLTNSNRVGEVVKNVRIARKVEYFRLNEKAKDLINVRGGMLNWRSGKLSPHDPSFLSTFQIDTNYDPDAKAPELDRFLEAILPADEIPVIEEFLGYLLIPDTSFNKCLVIVGEGGNGKALALDTPIPTPAGWTTQGALRPGDTIFNESGIPCKVLGISETWENRPCYRLKFSDGSEIVADGQHEWCAINARHQKVRRVVTTEQIAKRVIARERMIGKEVVRERLWGIQAAKPLQLPTADLPIDPYILGAWLGNGTSVASHLTSGEQDAQHYINEIRRLGYYAKPHYYQPGEVRIHISPTAWSRGWNRDSLKGRLRKLGVLGQKHIPISYLRASQDQRLALLQGLMDTDGSTLKTQAQCEFTSMTKVLAEGVFELVCSLGLRPTLTTGLATIEGRVIGEKYRVIFTTLPGVDVFRLPRKVAACQPRRSGLQRKIIACDPVPSVPVRCIQVNSPSRLYLCGRSMIPTHNSTLLDVAIGFLGEENVTHYSLHHISEEKFSVAGLFGSLANFYDELQTKQIKDTATFKIITGGSPLKAEDKGKSPFSFRPFCRLVFSANEMPRADDRSQAYFDRFVFIQLPNRIRGTRTEVREYAKVLLATPGVRPALLNRAISGLRRLTSQGKFSTSTSSSAVIEEYRRECNSAYDFIKEHCTFEDPTGWISKRDLYDRYRAWCGDNTRHPMSSRGFGKGLEAMNVRLVRHGEGRGWMGISWIDGVSPKMTQDEIKMLGTEDTEYGKREKADRDF